MVHRPGKTGNQRAHRRAGAYSGTNTLYFGSYFKGTKVAAVDEFDVLVILDLNNGVFSQNGISVGKDWAVLIRTICSMRGTSYPMAPG